MSKKMYKDNDIQMSLTECCTPLGKLNANNQWVKITNVIPWERFEPGYAKQCCEDNGALAIPFRMAMGALIIKQCTGHSDEETIQDIMEDPYLQCLIRMHEFTTEAPFAASSMTNFRKYISLEVVNEINGYMFRSNPNNKNNDDDRNNTKSGTNNTHNGVKPPANKSQNGNPKTETSIETQNIENEKLIPNSGTLLHDATCAPANIAYPTDINLPNEARGKLEKMIDALHGDDVQEGKKKARRSQGHTGKGRAKTTCGS
jgi:hypothetical protein